MEAPGLELALNWRMDRPSEPPVKFYNQQFSNQMNFDRTSELLSNDCNVVKIVIDINEKLR